MNAPKTEPADAPVEDFLTAGRPGRRREEARRALMGLPERAKGL